MATLTLTNKAPRYLADYWGEQADGAKLSGSGTKVTAKLIDPETGGVQTIVFTGTGLKVNDNGLAGGTVTKVELLGAKSVLFGTVSGLSVKAALLNTDAWNFGNELLKGADVIKGSSTGDDLEGGAGNDKVSAGAGDDYITDGIGNDSYDGGTGYDDVSYADTFWVRWLPAKGITADLKTGKVSDPWGGTDTLKNIEAIRGSHYNDKISGSDLTSATESFAGLAGNDTLDGRGGTDVAQYGRDYEYGGRNGISANLTLGKIRDGFGDTDTVKNIENVSGTKYADVIQGDAKNNYFYGDAGSDTLKGLAGNDTLQGATGNDKLYGGAGSDKFIFDSSPDRGDGDDTIYDFTDGQDKIVFTNSGGEVAAFDNLTITQSGGNTIISYDDSTIKLVGVNKSVITASDFEF